MKIKNKITLDNDTTYCRIYILNELFVFKEEAEVMSNYLSVDKTKISKTNPTKKLKGYYKYA